LVADFFPKKMAVKGANTPPTRRKFSEADCDVLELAVEELSDDALGRFWGE
jgi:hypothetical protein